MGELVGGDGVCASASVSASACVCGGDGACCMNSEVLSTGVCKSTWTKIHEHGVQLISQLKRVTFSLPKCFTSRLGMLMLSIAPKLFKSSKRLDIRRNGPTLFNWCPMFVRHPNLTPMKFIIVETVLSFEVLDAFPFPIFAK